jgi:hypothetical protein
VLRFNFRSPPFPYVDIGPRTPTDYAVFRLSISDLALFGILTKDVAFQFLGLCWPIVTFLRLRNSPIWRFSGVKYPCLISSATLTLPDDHKPLPEVLQRSPEIHEAYPTPEPEASCFGYSHPPFLETTPFLETNIFKWSHNEFLIPKVSLTCHKGFPKYE